MVEGIKIGGTWISSEYLRSFATAEDFAEHAHTRIMCEGMKDYIEDVDQRKQVLCDLWTSNVGENPGITAKQPKKKNGRTGTAE